jgi:diguanylate cyclase (GGDEF)-like protein
VALGTIWSSLKGKLLESRKPGAGRVDLEVAGQGLHTFAVSVTLLGPQGGQDRTVMVLRDITRQVITERELKAATLALHLLAHTDDLTTLANRRHFLDELSKEVDRSRRYGHSLSLIFLDLDHFKRVNDTYGHGMGDEVLQSTARAMESVCRDIDVAARMGGEEFAVLLPETDSEGARVVADRLRIEIAQRMHEPDGAEPFRVTASLGVATVEPGTETSVEELMQAADDALYDAKENGRNRVALSA